MLEPNVDALADALPAIGDGRYLVAGLLGKGAHARVYQAWDKTLRAWRAVKVLSPAHLEDAELRRRFQQEAEAMVQLDHEHIVKVYDMCDDPFTPYIVMELCAGGAVLDWMKVHGAVPPQRALRLIEQIARAAEAAHEVGIIHRDIKPQNILIDQHGAAKLTDFGIAREVDSSLTQAGSALGTFAYMAPEQRHDATQVDARADIYALGATLFTLVRVKTSTELFVAEPDDPIFEGMPEPLVSLILRACAYRPRERPQTIDALVDALHQVAAQLPEDPPDTPSMVALARPLPLSGPDTAPDPQAVAELRAALALRDERADPGGVAASEDAGPSAADLLDPETLSGSDLPVFDLDFPGFDAPSSPDATVEAGSAPTPEADPVSREEGRVVSASDPHTIDLEPSEDPTPAPTPHVDRPPTPSLRGPLLIAGAGVGGALLLAVALVAVLLAHSSMQLAAAAGDANRAESALVRAVLDSAPAVPHHPAAPALRPLYFQVQDAPAERAGPPARRFAAALAAAERPGQLDPDHALLLNNVIAADAAVQDAQRRWRERGASLSGRAAAAIGLAAPAPTESEAYP